MKIGSKYPKNIIERFDKFEKECNIEEINITIFQEDSHYTGDDMIKVVGEIIGDKLPYDISLLITVHNENGEVIGTNFDEYLMANRFNGIQTFSTDVSVATDEIIHKVRVYPVKNLACWE